MVLTKKPSVLTFLVCLVSCLLFCLEPLPPCNPNLISASRLTTLTDDPSNTQINPIGAEGGISTSTSFMHGMTQLNQIEIVSVINYRENSMYAAWQALNADDYSRQDIRFGVRYSQKYFRLGVGYKVLFDDIPGYGSEKDDRLSAGIRLYYKNTTMDLGLEHKLPFADNEGFTSGTFNLCLGQKLENNVRLAFGIDAAQSRINSYKMGCSFYPVKNFKAIASWDSEPGRFGVGAVFEHKWLNIAYGMQTHPELDWTHSVGITAMFK